MGFIEDGCIIILVTFSLCSASVILPDAAVDQLEQEVLHPMVDLPVCPPYHPIYLDLDGTNTATNSLELEQSEEVESDKSKNGEEGGDKSKNEEDKNNKSEKEEEENGKSKNEEGDNDEPKKDGHNTKSGIGNAGDESVSASDNEKVDKRGIEEGEGDVNSSVNDEGKGNVEGQFNEEGNRDDDALTECEYESTDGERDGGNNDETNRGTNDERGGVTIENQQNENEETAGVTMEPVKREKDVEVASSSRPFAEPNPISLCRFVRVEHECVDHSDCDSESTSNAEQADSKVSSDKPKMCCQAGPCGQRKCI